MEVGNYLFGNSRGEFPLERMVGFENELYRLFAATQDIREEDVNVNGEEFENETFSIFPYYWGECTCQRLVGGSEEHYPECLLEKPNFLFKPAGFKLKWYKHPIRDAYTNKKTTLAEFNQIINACIESLWKNKKS